MNYFTEYWYVWIIFAIMCVFLFSFYGKKFKQVKEKRKQYEEKLAQEKDMFSHLTSDVFESYSAGSEIKNQINLDAVRLMKNLYGIDMEKTQHPKLINEIPQVDMLISMGCNVGCPFVGKEFDDNWQLDDPTGKDDQEFIKVIHEIEEKILKLKEELTK